MAISDYVIGRPFVDGQGVDRSYRRNDLYVPTGNYDRVFVESLNDVSPIFGYWRNDNNNGRYNSDCSCCFLGITHSGDRHIESIARHVSGKVWGSYAGLVSVDVRPVEYGGEYCPIYPRWELWMVGEWGQSLYGVWDSEDGAGSAAAILREKVSK